MPPPQHFFSSRAQPQDSAVVRLLESPANPEWKALRKALSQGTSLEGRYWIAESPRLLEEAVRSGLSIPRIYASARILPQLQQQYASRIQTEWIQVSPRALQSVSATETSQQVIALVAKPTISSDAFFSSQRLLVILDRIQDPGNAGAIIRSAEAFGATGLVFLRGSVSPDSPKLLRASAGSLFRVPFLQDFAVDPLLSRVTAFALYSASPEAPQPIDSLTLRFPAALVIGNEGAGVSSALDAEAIRFRIPTQGVESLNAAVSAGIALYVLSRAVPGAQPMATPAQPTGPRR